MVLRHPGAVRRMLTVPLELGMGEAFIYEDFEIEGDLYAALDLLDRIAGLKLSVGDLQALLRQVRSLPNTGPARADRRTRAGLDGSLHSQERDRDAVRYHYDVGNDFYALWLDPLMQYSCGYFPSGNETLARAQELKIEHICRKLRLKEGERLLDIGCGWGGLALTAARNYGVQVTGVTLSEVQARHGQEWAEREDMETRVRIECRDYRELEKGSFDKIVSVGMFEHVGREHLPEYFAQVHRLLKPGGLFLNHGIARRTEPADLGLLRRLDKGVRRLDEGQKFLEGKVIGPNSFSQKYVFPDGELVPVSEANLIAESAGFEVRDVENLREHYAQTLRHWVRRLEERREDALRLVGEVVYRTWRLYMSFSAVGFESARTSVNQSLLARPDGGVVEVPRSRADLYRG